MAALAGDVGLLTIGEFARAARLTPKALRLYAERGLLPPAAVDPESGYRLYAPAQLEWARLIGELRTIGMSLAEIRVVSGLEPAAAARLVAAYWQRVSAENASRARHATLLVEALSRKGIPMSEATPAPVSPVAPASVAASPELTIRSAVRLDAGTGRDTFEDAAYTSDRILAVADGVRGPLGAAASRAAMDALRALEPVRVPATDLLALLARMVAQVDREVHASATATAQPATTLTALLLQGSHLALVHVGDTRAYLLRGGTLVPLTQDHTWVSTQVDQGLLTPEQAATHPQRAMLVRALGGTGQEVEADLALRTALSGDRYLLCSDGLHAVVDRAALYAALTAGDDPEATVDRLVELAYLGGAPDNIACVVADLVAA
jgi:serine/threonine protein phosphatase PrpC/DNA-binding transcriptional MerR regulator